MDGGDKWVENGRWVNSECVEGGNGWRVESGWKVVK